MNETNIRFTNGELTLLNKGLKYNLGNKLKHWIRDLGLEAECAITLLTPTGARIHKTPSGKTVEKTPDPTNPTKQVE